MTDGRVYWITGLSGSGKTTIGTALYYRLKETHDNLVILDGDILKLVTTGGYTQKERLVRASKYARLAKYLSDQGLWVILCTISMFDEVREWNRANIDNYIEVFLDVPMEVLRKRDRKGLYSSFAEGKVSDVAGLNGAAQFPKHPDVRLVNDGTLSTQSCVDRILQINPVSKGGISHLAIHWDEVYASLPVESGEPSDFARYVVDSLSLPLRDQHILELGCGAGNDSRYFLQQGAFLTSVDVSHVAIQRLQKVADACDRAHFICADFLKSQILFQSQQDVIYLRHVMEEVPVTRRSHLLENLGTALRLGGALFAEVHADDVWSAEQWKNAFHESGFSSVQQEYCGNVLRFLVKGQAASE